MGKYGSYETEDQGGRLFDGGEMEEEGDEGSRLPLLLVIGLLVVAAFGGVVYLAYTQGVQRGREDAPRMLVAASGPVKQAPANAGGADTPFKGLKIYQQPAPDDAADTETSPQSPTPKDVSHTVQQGTTQMAEAPTTIAPPVAPKAPPPASTKDDQLGSSENLSVSTDVATKPPAQLQAPKKPKPAPVPKLAAVTPAAPPAETPSATPAAAPAAAGGSAALQIGAYKSEDEANAAFKAFSQKHSMVSAYASEVKKVDLGDKGVWYRLRLAGFSDKSAASTFCDKLKADGGNCFLTK